eukprot:gene19755-26448_t
MVSAVEAGSPAGSPAGRSQAEQEQTMMETSGVLPEREADQIEEADEEGQIGASCSPSDVTPYQSLNLKQPAGMKTMKKGMVGGAMVLALGHVIMVQGSG